MEQSALDHKKSADVARLREKVRRVVPCGTCATGIAFDIVERHWHGGAGYEDWRGKRFGHSCRLTEKGATPAEDAALQAIEREYTGKEFA